jgi:hypothetical protein
MSDTEPAPEEPEATPTEGDQPAAEAAETEEATEAEAPTADETAASEATPAEGEHPVAEKGRRRPRRPSLSKGVGLSPIPAMSMASYAAGTRFLSVIGGPISSFYNCYADLPMASPQVFSDQTDVPESGDFAAWQGRIDPAMSVVGPGTEFE